MLCKNAASVTIGISMDQEICLIHGQVSLSLLYWQRNLQTDFVVQVETDQTAGNIQARPFMARALDKIWEKHKWANEKPKPDNARRLRGIYFIDPEDKELFEETI